MTKTTREIEEDRNWNTGINAFVCAIMFSFLISAFLYITLDEKISQLPHKVCHNETIYGDRFFRNYDYENIFNQKAVPLSASYWDCRFTDDRYVKICVEVYEKEVCEIE